MSTFSLENAKPLMPRTIADEMITQARSDSVIMRLSPRRNMRYGDTDIVTFSDFPEAEFVGENENKGSTTGAFGSVTAKVRKAQVTMRFSKEVLLLDEAHQLDIVRSLSEQGSKSLARALDFGMIHRIQPTTGTTFTAIDSYIAKTTKRVERDTADADDDVRTAVGLLVKSAPPVAPNGLAISGEFAWDLANLKVRDGSGATSQPRYPSLGFGTDVQNFLGLKTAQGDTVRGTRTTDTKIRAIVGDFVNGAYWGVPHEIPLEVIKYGDPDGQGDLARKNQVAIRMEIFYSWYVFDDRFAVIEDAA